MSRKKDFNEGIASGIKLAESIVKQNTAAMEYVMEKVGDMHNGQSIIRSSVEDLLKEMNVFKAMQLYGIVVPKAPKEILNEEYLKILFNYINVYNQVYETNDAQKQFINNVRRYYNYLSGFGFNPDFNIFSMDNVKETEASKEIFRILKMYDFLRDMSFETSSFDNDMWESFHLNRYTKEDICNSIEIIYGVFGEDGIIECYGEYDAEEINEQTIMIEDFIQDEPEYIDIGEDCISVLRNEYFEKKVYEGSSYIALINDEKTIITINKENGKDFEYKNMINENGSINVYGEYVVYSKDNTIYSLKMGEKDPYQQLLFESNEPISKIYFVAYFLCFYS